MTRNRGPPAKNSMGGDLFGFDDPKEPAGKGKVALALVLHRESKQAWLLGETDKLADAKWIPKSLAVRGEGRDEHVWTLPSWKARELGWA